MTVGYSSPRAVGLSFNGSNAHTISGIDGPTNTFLDSLVQQGVIDHAIWSMVVPPLDATTGPQVGEGEILFGGYDETKVQGDIAWLDVIDPYDEYTWNFNVGRSSCSVRCLSLMLIPDFERWTAYTSAILK